MNPNLGPSPVEVPHLGGEASFPAQIYIANNETNAETKTAEALFNGQRMEKWKLSSNISFSTWLGLKQLK